MVSAPRFIGLSTGRTGSRYLRTQLSNAGVQTMHERTDMLKSWSPANGAVGEVSAWLVTQMEQAPEAQVWHFTRHPQPFVRGLMKSGFWEMSHPNIHPFLRRTDDPIVNSFLYWVDWNQRILDGAEPPRRTTFRIEDIDADLIARLAETVGIEADTSKIEPTWREARAPMPIPAEVAGEVIPLMETLGYARCG